MLYPTACGRGGNDAESARRKSNEEERYANEGEVKEKKSDKRKPDFVDGQRMCDVRLQRP